MTWEQKTKIMRLVHEMLSNEREAVQDTKYDNEQAVVSHQEAADEAMRRLERYVWQQEETP